MPMTQTSMNYFNHCNGCFPTFFDRIPGLPRQFSPTLLHFPLFLLWLGFPLHSPLVPLLLPASEKAFEGSHPFIDVVVVVVVAVLCYTLLRQNCTMFALEKVRNKKAKFRQDNLLILPFCVHQTPSNSLGHIILFFTLSQLSSVTKKWVLASIHLLESQISLQMLSTCTKMGLFCFQIQDPCMAGAVEPRKG